LSASDALSASSSACSRATWPPELKLPPLDMALLGAVEGAVEGSLSRAWLTTVAGSRGGLLGRGAPPPASAAAAAAVAADAGRSAGGESAAAAAAAAGAAAVGSVPLSLGCLRAGEAAGLAVAASGALPAGVHRPLRMVETSTAPDAAVGEPLEEAGWRAAAAAAAPVCASPGSSDTCEARAPGPCEAAERWHSAAALPMRLDVKPARGNELAGQRRLACSAL
jgi:hypothetical protein